MWGMALGGLGALLGGMAGSQGQQSTQNYAKQVAPEGALEKQAGDMTSRAMTGFEDMVNYGPGQADVKAGLASQQNLGNFLEQMFNNGGLPNAQQMGFANQLTNDVFAPEQIALQQRFQDAQTFGNRQAARMGRSGSDPILMNKLLQEQTRQQQMLGGQMTAFRAQQAQAMPQQQLQLASQLAQVRSGLASQAMQNRQALFSMGSQLKGQEQNFRAGTASTNVTNTTGGGMLGGLAGALSMGGTMFNAGTTFGNAGGFGQFFNNTPSSPLGADNTGGMYGRYAGMGNR